MSSAGQFGPPIESQDNYEVNPDYIVINYHFSVFYFVYDVRVRTKVDVSFDIALKRLNNMRAGALGNE